MKKERGQGLVEYALILVLVAVVFIVMVALVVPKIFNPPQPPAMDAPLLEVVRWCEGQAYDTYTVTESYYDINSKTTKTRAVTKTKDSPEKFVACMQSYEYMVKR